MYGRRRVWSDIGTLSILWSQPVTALQIMSPDGIWRYVKHIPNGLVRTTTTTSPGSYNSFACVLRIISGLYCSICLNIIRYSWDHDRRLEFRSRASNTGRRSRTIGTR